MTDVWYQPFKGKDGKLFIQVKIGNLIYSTVQLSQEEFEKFWQEVLVDT